MDSEITRTMQTAGELVCTDQSYLIVVGLVREQFGAHVVGRADEGAGHVAVALQHSGDPQVTHFDDICSC